MLTQTATLMRRSNEVTGRMLLRRGHRSVCVGSISSGLTKGIKKLSIAILVVCALTSKRAGAQAITGHAGADASQLAQPESAQVVPSDSATASATSIQGDHLNSQTAPRKHNHAETISGSLTMGAIPGEIPSLCFVPGIGWQRILISPLSEIEKVGTAGKQGSGAPYGTWADGSTAAYAQPSGAKQSTSNECSGMLTKAMVPGVAVDNGIGVKHAQVMTSIRATTMNKGAQDWLQANSLLNPASGAASQRLMMRLPSMQDGGAYVSAGSRSGVSQTQINGFKPHAYVSSIQLRRMIHSSQDLETKIKLQELQERLAKKSRNSQSRVHRGQIRKSNR